MGCKHCKKDLEHLPGKRKKEFCNDTCRSNFWQKERRRKNNSVKLAKEKMEEKESEPVVSAESTPKEEKQSQQVADSAPKLKFEVLLEMAKAGSPKELIMEAVKANKAITPNQKELIYRKAGIV